MKPRLTGFPDPGPFRKKMARAGRLYLSLLGLLAAGAAAPAATLEELARQPALWPAEVKLTAATKAVVLKDGQPAGTMLLGAGKTLVVAGISAEGVTGRAGGATVRVPVDKTDLPARVGITPPPAVEQEKETVKYAPAADAQSRAKLPQPESPAAVTPVQRLFVGHLVQLQDGALRYYEMRRLNGVKYYGIMFSAGWCGPCRAFAPQLLDHYRRLRESYPEFELILISRDNSAGEMAAYMREEQMPWPALKYDASRSLAEIERLAGPGIPCLVLIDAEGRVLAHSFRGDTYLGPASVLDAAWRILKKNHRG